MTKHSKEQYIEKLSDRTNLSKDLLSKFSHGDLKGYFERAAHPYRVQLTNAVGIGLVLGALAGFAGGAVALPVAAVLLTAGLTGVGWASSLGARNQDVLKDISQRVAAVAPKVPEAR